jgi:predicted ArsR family transcriptional regulator
MKRIDKCFDFFTSTQMAFEFESSVTAVKGNNPAKRIDNFFCQCIVCGMRDVEVIDRPEVAAVALDSVRSRLLAELSQPASAATLAIRVGLPRQKVNYHLRTLEAHGLVKSSSERRWGGLTERLLVATASSYVVSPKALGPVASSPERTLDRLAASYLIAIAARVVSEVGEMVLRAEEAGKPLATLSVDTVVRFRSATERAAFTQELSTEINKLVSKYHDESAPGGRAHRVVLGAHPLPKQPTKKES